MPPPSKVLPKLFFVKQLRLSDNIVPTATTTTSTSTVEPLLVEALSNTSLFSVTRTPEEVSIVGAVDDLNENLLLREYADSGGWRCIQIAGPMDFGLTGVLCDFSTPLKRANIPIYALSTWNTDYILIPKDDFERAVLMLTEDGWCFT